ncbi:MAG: acyl-CoA synthetase, partial [Candidatus Dormiibacterota bacterium]
ADSHWGEAVTAVVLVREDAPVSGRELIDHVRRRKGPVQAPKACYVVQGIPRTALGKIDKKRLREEFRDRAP